MIGYTPVIDFLFAVMSLYNFLIVYDEMGRHQGKLMSHIHIKKVPAARENDGPIQIIYTISVLLKGEGNY